ncbi:hypothetical protein [Streptacidiphilus carbonis]|uniref:hypothetical protein n=1 Tax=Streptacidiphilus carbonis TaxID=105422 RepID=UPI0005A9C570|nr:hypothetical protein [Streptacidiphilus carbonis]
MTVPYSSDLYKAVLPGGAVTFQVMFETFYASGLPQAVTGVTITITANGSSTPVLGPTSVGVVAAGNSNFSYEWLPAATVPPGDYAVLWSATGTAGAVTYAQAVTVSAFPATLPAPGVYASAAQYRDWSADMFTPDDLVTVALRRATEVIDRVLVAAVYATDADGMPIDAGVVNVFMRATSAQAQFILANNDFANVKSQYSSTSMGGVSQTRAASAQNQMFPPLAPQAAAILQVAGVLPSAPLINW